MTSEPEQPGLPDGYQFPEVVKINPHCAFYWVCPDCMFQNFYMPVIKDTPYSGITEGGVLGGSITQFAKILSCGNCLIVVSPFDSDYLCPADWKVIGTIGRSVCIPQEDHNND